ncbi:MAG: hypothetical protein H0V82_05515 [Candidatus Protochlamydia sp.]|nr:hypothetical protein [Candidatus Protochlamydia sp.]
MTDYLSQSFFESNLFLSLFESNLSLALKVEADGKEAELPTGNIEKISLRLFSYGYACHLQFSTFDNDDLYEILTGPKVIKTTLTFKPSDPKAKEPMIELKGILTDKKFIRLPPNINHKEQANRMYEIYFVDHAKATWEQHYPTNIYVDESMKDVIEKHVNPEVKMNYKWDPIEVKHPTTAFSLQHQYWCKPEEQTNFYSFLMWYLHKENGLLEYDFKEHHYTITGKKKEPSGPPLKLPERFVTSPLCILSQSPRYNEKNLKHTAGALDPEDKENEDSFQSVRREHFDPNHYRVFPEQAQEKINSTLLSDKHEVEINITEFTEEIQLDKLVPGSFVSFTGDLDGNWSQDPCFKDKNFRIRQLDVIANKIGVTEEGEQSNQGVRAFNLYVKLKLEDEEAVYAEWPKFIPPTFPFYVQGKIFCDIGDKEQSTYKILESEKAPQGQYLVSVPLAGEKKVVAPFVPAYSGQYFYPFIKDTNVMVEMHFHTAKIERPIDWDALARLPAGVQGNQMVLASNGKDKYTIMRHEYVDGKDSLYTVKQSSSEEQMQTIEMKEKDILIAVDEKDKKTLFLQLNHGTGFVLSLEDKNAGNHQQIVFDGTSMIHTCKGSDGTSIIIQKPDSIAIECKKFSIKAETICMEASDSITLDGKNKFDVKTKVANVAAPAVKLGN